MEKTLSAYPQGPSEPVSDTAPPAPSSPSPPSPPSTLAPDAGELQEDVGESGVEGEELLILPPGPPPLPQPEEDDGMKCSALITFEG